MLRFALIAVAFAATSTPALADPVGLCGLEEVTDPTVPKCPTYITYGEEGQEIGGEAGR